MSKEDNNLGIEFGDIMDLDQLIDTEAGALVVDPNKPIKKEEGGKTDPPKGDLKEDLIEVNKEKSGSNSDTQEGDGDDNLLLNNKVLENISRALYEKGVISELDDEKLKNIQDNGDAEILVSLIKDEITKNISGYKEGLPEKVRRVIDNYEEGVPLDIIIGLESADTRLDNLTEDQIKENEDLQKVMIQENLRRKGDSDEKIKRRIQQFSDLNQLEEEALDAFTESKDYIKTSKDLELKRAKEDTIKTETSRKENLDSLQKDINSTSEILSGIKLSEREKKTIFESMTKAVDQDKDGRPMNAVMVTRNKNVLGFEKLLHYYHSLGLFNVDDKGNFVPDISKIKAGAKASAMDELNSVMTTRQSSSAGSPAGEPRTDNSKMKANIAAMKKVFG